MSRRQAADVVVRLDRLGDAVGAAGLDHVGVERPLHEPRDVAERARLVLEDADELLADPLALLLGVGRRPRAARGTAPAPARGRAARGSGSPNVSTTCSASSLRSRPWSTKTHVSWSPTALCTSSAATARVDAAGERAEHALAADLRRGSARPAPRSPRPASTSAARRRPRRGSSSARPGRAACARPPGGTARRRGRARRPRTPRPAWTPTPATTRAPAGGAMTESRCDIHTVCSAGRSRTARARSTRSSVLPNSPAPVRSTRPPSSSAISCAP